MKLMSNPTLTFGSSATYTAITSNRAFPVQPTANPKKAIECWSCSYGKLPPTAGALDYVINLVRCALKRIIIQSILKIAAPYFNRPSLLCRSLVR